MKTWSDNLREEIVKGGQESPCPFCHLPRVKRSDYIRCVRCGVNWIDGEALDKDPRRQRLEKFLRSAAMVSIKKEPKKE